MFWPHSRLIDLTRDFHFEVTLFGPKRAWVMLADKRDAGKIEMRQDGGSCFLAHRCLESIKRTMRKTEKANIVLAGNRVKT